MQTKRDFIAKHIHAIGSSGIRRIFDLGASMVDPINLSIGQPDFPIPPKVCDAMVEAIRDGRTGYTVTRGLPELRDRIARQLSEEFDWQPDLFVTSGVSGGLFLAFAACLNPGDQVLMADPYFVSYPHLVRLVGGEPVFVDIYPDFSLNVDRFAEAITPRTKLLLIASPGNPTGIVFGEDELAALAELAHRHDLLIVTDEIYCDLAYEGRPPSIVRFAPDRTLLLRGYAKSYAMTGLRMGYAAGPSEIITEMAKLQQYTFVCAPHPAQVGAIEAMDVDLSVHVDAYRAKRDLVCAALGGSFEFAQPSGGFYVFPKVPSRFASAGEFVEAAIDKNVLLIPGDVFSNRDSHFRISYAAPDEKLREGCEILCSLVK